MADTFIWDITNLEHYVQDGTVIQATWTLTGERDNSGELICKASTYGTTGFFEPDPSQFIPYDQLTKEICIGWVKSTIGAQGCQDLEVALSEQMDLIQDPVTANGVPWPTVFPTVVNPVDGELREMTGVTYKYVAATQSWVVA